jgi:hypothetical protein
MKSGPLSAILPQAAHGRAPRFLVRQLRETLLKIVNEAVIGLNVDVLTYLSSQAALNSLGVA